MSESSNSPANSRFDISPISGTLLYQTITQRYGFLSTLSQLRSFFGHGLTILLLAVSLFGFYQLGSLALEVHHTDTSHVAAAASPTGTPKKQSAAPAVNSLPRSTPTELVIPSINVDAPVVGVSQNSDGTIEVPGPTDTGWYTPGPSPGEVGPAVIVGHVDYVNVGEAVFWNLHNMKAGDEVTVNRQDGSTVKFKVTSVESYGQDAFPTQKVYGNIDYPGLRLVTCAGDFNYATHHYSDDLVVYARAEL